MKNWLIRTKTNYILGPVSREKLLELIASGSITDEDELCSGNGYWFFFREKKLVEQYITENNQQSFNPVSEALNEKRIRSLNEKEGEQESPTDDITLIMKPK